MGLRQGSLRKASLRQAQTDMVTLCHPELVEGLSKGFEGLSKGCRRAIHCLLFIQLKLISIFTQTENP